MDANKLSLLRSLQYRIGSSCGMCKHGVFRDIKDDFGSCMLQTYEHQKHTGPARQLSVHRNGSCPKYVPDPAKVARLGAWAEFVKEDEGG